MQLVDVWRGYFFEPGSDVEKVLMWWLVCGHVRHPDKEQYNEDHESEGKDLREKLYMRWGLPIPQVKKALAKAKA